METEYLSAPGKAVTLLAEAGGAIGLICGILLIAVLFFFKNLMSNLQERDHELHEINKQLQNLMVNNTAAMTILAQVLQRRKCLAQDENIVEKINKATEPNPGREE